MRVVRNAVRAAQASKIKIGIAKTNRGAIFFGVKRGGTERRAERNAVQNGTPYVRSRRLKSKLVSPNKIAERFVLASRLSPDHYTVLAMRNGTPYGMERRAERNGPIS